MISVCLADNYPVVHFGIKSYFKDHPEISIVSNVGNFFMVPDALRNKQIDVLIIDLELDGLKSIFELKSIIQNFPKTKVLLFTSLNEQIYGSNAIKAGVAGFVQKSSKLEALGTSIIRVHQGLTVMSDSIKRNLALVTKQSLSQTLFKKLSNREVEVLRYLSMGKKNYEIAKLLNLNEKTVSTYKLRLLQKLEVTNIVDLIKKGKALEII